jgi:hypothetical protein
MLRVSLFKMKQSVPMTHDPHVFKYCLLYLKYENWIYDKQTDIIFFQKLADLYDKSNV